MGCILVILGLIAPRLVIILLALFTKALHHAFETALWPVLGFLFMPYTTLAYTWALNVAGGVRGLLWIGIMVVAVLIDVSALREGGRQGKERWS